MLEKKNYASMELRSRTVDKNMANEAAPAESHIWTTVEHTPSEEELAESSRADNNHDDVSATVSLKHNGEKENEEETDTDDDDECDHHQENCCRAFFRGLKEIGASILRFLRDVLSRIPKKYVVVMCTVFAAFIRQSCTNINTSSDGSTEVDPDDLNDNGVDDTLEEETEVAVIDALADTVVSRV